VRSALFAIVVLLFIGFAVSLLMAATRLIQPLHRDSEPRSLSIRPGFRCRQLTPSSALMGRLKHHCRLEEPFDTLSLVTPTRTLVLAFLLVLGLFPRIEVDIGWNLHSVKCQVVATPHHVHSHAVRAPRRWRPLAVFSRLESSRRAPDAYQASTLRATESGFALSSSRSLLTLLCCFQI
jgi:hypothetical protein